MTTLTPEERIEAAIKATLHQGRGPNIPVTRDDLRSVLATLSTERQAREAAELEADHQRKCAVEWFDKFQAAEAALSALPPPVPAEEGGELTGQWIEDVSSAPEDVLIWGWRHDGPPTPIHLYGFVELVRRDDGEWFDAQGEGIAPPRLWQPAAVPKPPQLGAETAGRKPGEVLEEGKNQIGAAELAVGQYVYRRIERLMDAKADTAEARELDYLADMVDNIEEYGARGDEEGEQWFARHWPVPPQPPQDVAGLVEEIARITDPDAWATRDRHYAGIDGLPATRTDKADLRKSADTYTHRSIIKAKDILSALRPSPISYEDTPLVLAAADNNPEAHSPNSGGAR